MIFARIESLILNNGMDDALKRAKAYISAGADGIMIHSKKKDGQEIIDFCKTFEKFEKRVPLVVVPSTFSHLTIDDFRNYFKKDKKKKAYFIDEILRTALNISKGSLNDIRIIENQVNFKNKLIGYPSELMQVFINIFNNAKLV